MDFKDLRRGLGKRKTGATINKTGRIINLPWDWVRSDGVYGAEQSDPWVYSTIPTVPLAWSDRDERLQVGGQLHSMLAALGETSRIPMASMPTLADNRMIHLISITLDAPPKVPTSSSPEHANLLTEVFESTGDVPLRLCMIGIRCMPPKITDDPTSGKEMSFDSWIEAGKIILGIPSADLDIYANDIDLIKSIVYKFGGRPPTGQERSILESWYNRGSGNGVQIRAYPTWLDIVDSQDKIEFATVRKFESVAQKGTQYTWASAAASHPSGAITISVRGELEPASVVIKRMLSTQRRQRSVLKESSSSGDLIDETQIDKFRHQRDVEGYLRNQGEAVLVRTSIVMARYANKVTESYTDMLNNRFQISVRPHWNRQISALRECMPCADTQLSRFEQPMNIAGIAYAGLGAFGELGDNQGLLIGVVDPDMSLCWLDPGKASAGSGADQSPGVAILGDPGSGKALSYNTVLPTPTGETTMGDVKIGDQLLDRRGQPCTIQYISETNHTPDLYQITFSDGQTIQADWDHQWITSSRADRNKKNDPHHQDAKTNWIKRQTEVQDIQQLADLYTDDQLLTGPQLLETLHNHQLATQWQSRHVIRSVLKFVGCPSILAHQLPNGIPTGLNPSTCLYPAATAIKSVAMRLSQQNGPQPHEGEVERVLTTGDMIQEGILVPGKTYRRNFSIPVPEPMQLPTAHLPIHPWLLGAWLGDGNSRTHQLFTDTTDATEMAQLIQQYSGVPTRIKLGDPDSSSPNKATVFWSTPDNAVPFLHQLYDLDLYANKHIPMRYLRASYEQRLALLQGLMDTDGSITDKGECIISLSDKRLAMDTAKLIRSLGIVINPIEYTAHIVEDDPDNPGNRRRRPTNLAWRMCFTTNLMVFKLARKAAKVPTGHRSPEQKRVYIVDIQPVTPVPARCVQVDSPDGSYQCGQHLLCHNTFLMQWLAYQSALLGRAVIYINPKPQDNLQGLAELVGQYRRSEIISLGDALAQPGSFDPFRFAPAEYAHTIAAMYIMDVLGPQWDQGQQIRLQQGLRRAAISGVRSTGEAIKHFVEDRQVVGETMGLVEADPTFALGVALRPRGDMVVGRGLTLIQFDQSWPDVEPLADPSKMPLSDRVILAIMRLIPRASLEILLRTGQGGDLYVDEAHRLLASKAGQSFVERQGREGRSQQIMSVFGTHRPTEITRSGLDAFMGRIIALKLQNPGEAKEALKLVGLEPTQPRIDAMQHFGPRAPADGRPPKPAQCLLRDIERRHAGVVIHPVPEWVRKLLSTSSADVTSRLVKPPVDRPSPLKDPLSPMGGVR